MIGSILTELRLRKWARSLGIDIYGHTCVSPHCETDLLKRGRSSAVTNGINKDIADEDNDDEDGFAMADNGE